MVRIALVAATLVVLAVMGEGTGRADVVCKQLHCFCDGPDRPDTVASCDTTCEAVCGGSGGGAQSSTPNPAYARQRFSMGALAGPGYRVVDSAGVKSTGPFALGMDLRMVGGGRPFIGVALSIGAMFTSVKAPHTGPSAKTMVFMPILFGLTSSPKLWRTRRSEVRLELGADLGFAYRFGCSTCSADHLGRGAFAYQLRAGFDVYFGKKKETGLGLDAVLMLGKEGDVHDSSSPSLVEVLPPTVLLRLAFLWRNIQLAW